MKTRATKRQQRNARARRAPSRRGQGLAGLGTYRVTGSADVKRRSQQKGLQRRPHAARSEETRPDSLLGQPDMNWTGQQRRRGSFAPR